MKIFTFWLLKDTTCPTTSFVPNETHIKIFQCFGVSPQDADDEFMSLSYADLKKNGIKSSFPRSGDVITDDSDGVWMLGNLHWVKIKEG